jgi:hypothetical protein
MRKKKTGRPSATVFFCSPSLQENEKKLFALLKKSFPEACLEVFTHYPDLAFRLIHPKEETSLAVIVLSKEEETRCLLQVRNMISDTAIIVVLPDDSLAMISLAHRLRPQFIGYFDSDFSELISVIGRMIDIRITRGRSL